MFQRSLLRFFFLNAQVHDMVVFCSWYTQYDQKLVNPIYQCAHYNIVRPPQMSFIIDLHNEPRDGFSENCSSGVDSKKVSSFWVYFLVMPPTAYVQLCFSAANTCNNLKITFLGLRSLARKPSLDPKFRIDRVITANLNSSPVFHFFKWWILSPSLLKKHYELFNFI